MPEAITYERRRPEATTLYQVVQDNLETLYGAVDDGAVKLALPRFVKKELEGYLDCGLLCRGFARLRCDACAETRLVAFACKGRGFCPSCLGRKMSATAANLVDYVMPKVALRQWVLTVPFAWRSRLGFDGALLGAVVRKFADAVLAFYRRRLAEEDGVVGQSEAVLVVQRTSSDLRLNPHVHAVFLDGVHHEGPEGEVDFHALSGLQTEEIARVLEDAARRITRYLRRRGLFADDGDEDTGALTAPQGDESVALAELAATAASGMTPPAGPSWRRGALPALTHDRDFDRHLSVGRGGFTLHAATRAGAMDERGRGREALLRYVLRPPIAQERVTPGPEGLVRVALKKRFSDGTFAVDLDPLSLLTRLCASVPPPRFHTVRYVGVLASASKLRPRILPEPPREASGTVDANEEKEPRPRRCRYRPWAELMMRTFAVDVLCCPRCLGRLRLVALMTEPKEIRRYLRALAEPTEAPARSPARGSPNTQRGPVNAGHDQRARSPPPCPRPSAPRLGPLSGAQPSLSHTLRGP